MKPATKLATIPFHLHLIVVCAVLMAGSPARGQNELLTMAREATRLREQQNLPQAITLLREMVETYPTVGFGWFYLGFCLHANNELDEAIQMHRKATEFPQFRSAALYNIACVHSLRGELDAAFEYLGRAEDAGFNEFNTTLRSDADLDNLRGDQRFDMWMPVQFTKMPPDHESAVSCAIILPGNFDAGRAYPVLLAIADEFQEPDSIRDALRDYWGRFAARRGWIVVSPTSPLGGWRSARSEALLEALVDHLRETYKVQDGRFDIVGLGAGAVEAFHIALDRPDDFRSVTAIAGTPPGRFDGDRLHRLQNVRIHMIVGDKDDTQRRLSEQTHDALREAGVDSELSVLNQYGQVEFIQLRFGGLMERIARHVNEPVSSAASNAP